MAPAIFVVEDSLVSHQWGDLGPAKALCPPIGEFQDQEWEWVGSGAGGGGEDREFSEGETRKEDSI